MVAAVPTGPWDWGVCLESERAISASQDAGLTWILGDAGGDSEVDKMGVRLVASSQAVAVERLPVVDEVGGAIDTGATVGLISKEMAIRLGMIIVPETERYMIVYAENTWCWKRWLGQGLWTSLR
jgi:hypothetical protein